MAEHAPMLRVVWHDLAAPIAALVREHPALGRRLLFAPRRAMHAYAVAVHTAAEDGTEATLDLACRLEATHPRTLVARALPGCSSRLYNLLDRCGDAAHPPRFYRDLHAALLGPHATLLEQEENIDNRKLQFLVALETLAPLAAKACKALGWSVTRAEAFDDMVRLLHDHGLDAADNAVGVDAPVGSKAFHSYVRRQLNKLGMPPLPFVTPSNLRPLTTIGEVRAAGRDFGNCLVSFGGLHDGDWTDFVAGTRVYLTAADPKLMICIRRLGPNTWWIEQIAGPGNTVVEQQVNEAVRRDLVASGLQILHIRPDRALTRLLTGLESRSRWGLQFDAFDAGDLNDDVGLAA